MRVDAVGVDRGDEPGRARLWARVRVDRAPASVETIWIDVPEELEPSLDRSGNPWVALLLPLAASYGERLEVPLPVDRPLLLGAREVLRVWRTWYRDTAVVEVVAPERERPATPSRRRTMAFFSAGVDSFFTALGRRDGDGVAERGPIHDLVFVEGFDVRLESRAALAGLRTRIPEAARGLGLPCLRLATNVRATRWDEVDWPMLGNGGALAAVALALGRHDLALLPGSVYYGNMVSWGSHPYADLRLSSWDLTVRHDGSETDRPDKIRAIAAHEVARRHLRVCFRSPEAGNCGACKKCLLTMVTLDLEVGLDACPSFAAHAPGYLDRLARAEVWWPSDLRHLRSAHEAAKAAGRADVARVARGLLDGVVEKPWVASARIPGRRLPRWLRPLLRRDKKPTDVPGAPDPEGVR